jgi:DNA primase
LSRFTTASVERVKDAADIVEIVSAYTDLRRVGERYTGLCPFHDERTPSFSVDAREKLYYCFGCEAGGDVFQFVQEKEGLAFPESVERLAERFGVELELEQEDPQAEEQRKRRTRLGELLERTATFYTTYLWESEEAAKAREYLASRRLGEEVLRRFGVGYAPSAWDQVLTRGQRAGFSIAELLAAGLLKKNRQGREFDGFRARIMFPIRDGRGRIQGFGGRALRAETKPKYLNSPEGELYRKSRTLYAIDLARPAIAKAGRAVVVEGYTDVLAAHQAGFAETVAVMGTAITPEQLGILATHVEEVVLALDADRAGREAMLRAQRVATGKRVRLRVATLPGGKDPADLLSEGDAAARAAAADRFREALGEAIDVPAFQVRTVLDDADLATAAGRDRALDEVVPVLAAMPDSITREELGREVADRLDADPGLVARRVAGVGGPRAPRGSGGASAGADAAPRALSGRERRERMLLAMCAEAPAIGREYLERLTPEHLSSPVAGRALEWLRDHLDYPFGALPREDRELSSYAAGMKLDAEREPASREAMELSFLQLEHGLVDRRIATEQEKGGDPPVELQRRRNELSEQIAQRDTVAGHHPR